MEDLLSFMLILLVLVIAFGLAMHITLFPNTQLGMGLMWDVMRTTYYRIYGELLLDELEGIWTLLDIRNSFQVLGIAIIKTRLSGGLFSDILRGDF